ncbi:MAG: tetratricopeptide repeat protein [Sulfurihydrogenibium sp.]|nr:tetratricopeptide repeat protein [Sulfurihydrogenibium sp.]
MKKSLKTVALFSVLACVGISYAQQEIDACWKFQDKDFQKAIEYGKLAVKKYPNNPLAYHCLGIAYTKIGDNKLAYNNLKKAETLTNDKKELMKIDKDIAQTLSFMNRSNDAITYYNKALSLAKELGDTESQIDILLKMSQEYLSPNFGKNGLDKAIAYGEEAVKLEKDEPSKTYAYNLIATAYHKKGDYQKEIETLKKIVDIDKRYKNYGDILTEDVYIGELYTKMKDYTNAEKYLLEAIEYGKKEKFNEEEMANAYKDLGDVYKNKGDKKKAKEYYQRAYDIYNSIGQGDLAEQIQKEINKLK